MNGIMISEKYSTSMNFLSVSLRIVYLTIYLNRDPIFEYQNLNQQEVQ